MHGFGRDPIDPSQTQLVGPTFLLPSTRTKWEICCRKAIECCMDHRGYLPTRRAQNQALLDEPIPRDRCPATWDGLNCWPETEAGSVNSLPCEKHIYFLEFEPVCMGEMHKTCHHNGSWFVRPFDNHEWTNYTNCKDLPVSIFTQIDQLELPCANQLTFGRP